MTAFVEPRGPFTVDFDLSGDTPRLTYSAPGDPQLFQSNYWWSAAMDHFEKNDADQWAYRADAEYEFDNNSFLKSFSFGGRATDRSATSRSTGWNWGILSRQHWSCPDEFTECQPTAFLNEQGGEGFAPAGPNPGLPINPSCSASTISSVVMLPSPAASGSRPRTWSATAPNTLSHISSRHLPTAGAGRQFRRRLLQHQ